MLRRPELAGLPVVVGGRGDPTERGRGRRPRRTTPASTASAPGMPLRVARAQVPGRGVPAGRRAGVRRGLGAGDGHAARRWSGAGCRCVRGGARLGRGVPRAGAGARRAGRPGRASRQHDPRRGARPRPGCTARSASATTSCGPRSPPSSASRAGRYRLDRRRPGSTVMGERPTDALWGIGRKTAQAAGGARHRHRRPAGRRPTPGCWPRSSGRRWGRGTTGSAAAWTPARSTRRRGCRGRTAARRPTRPTSRTGTRIADEVRALTARVVADIDREGRPAARVGHQGAATGRSSPSPAASPCRRRPTTRDVLADAAVSLLDRVEQDRAGAAARRTAGDGRAAERAGDRARPTG